MTTAGPMRSSSSAPRDWSSSWETLSSGIGPLETTIASRAGSSSSPVPGHCVCRWAVGCDIGPSVGERKIPTPASNGNGAPIGAMTSGCNDERPWPGRSTT